MAMKFTLYHENWPTGKRLSMKGLPPLENGRAVVLSDEEVKKFKEVNGKTIAEAFKDSEFVKYEVVAGKSEKS